MNELEIKIFNKEITSSEIERLAQGTHISFVKAVVDLDQSIVGLGGEMHSDIEQVLLEQGSRQKNLWGLNLYPGTDFPEMVEFDSLINIRPRDNNPSRGVEDEEIRKNILNLLKGMIKK